MADPQAFGTWVLKVHTYDAPDQLLVHLAERGIRPTASGAEAGVAASVCRAFRREDMSPTIRLAEPTAPDLRGRRAACEARNSASGGKRCDISPYLSTLCRVTPRPEQRTMTRIVAAARFSGGDAGCCSRAA